MLSTLRPILTAASLLVLAGDANAQLDFVGTPASGPAPLAVSFAPIPQTIDQPLWSFGDGSTSTAIAPIHTYTSPGSYTVTLTALVNDVIQTVTKYEYIDVSAIVDRNQLATGTLGPNLISARHNCVMALPVQLPRGPLALRRLHAASRSGCRMARPEGSALRLRLQRRPRAAARAAVHPLGRAARDLGRPPPPARTRPASSRRRSTSPPRVGAESIASPTPLATRV